MGSSPVESPVRIRVSVAGTGLAACTSARLQTQEGSFYDARIISAPTATLPSVQQASTVRPGEGVLQQPGRLSMEVMKQKLTEMGRKNWQRFLSRGAPAVQPGPAAAEEQLLLEAKLKHADAQAIVSGFTRNRDPQSKASSILRVHLRSDFEVVRTEVQLSRRQAWLLGSSPKTLERVLVLLTAAASKHARLPGVKMAAAESISYTCLAPPRHDLSAVAQLAAQQIQSSRSQKDSGQTSDVQAAAYHSDMRMSAAQGSDSASQVSEGIDRRLSLVPAAYRAQAAQAAQKLSTGLTSSLQRARLAADRTAAAARGQVQRLRHRHAVQALQQHSAPDMLVLCLPGQRSSARAAPGQPMIGLYGALCKSRAQAAHSPFLKDAAVMSLIEEAHRAQIPVLVILSTEGTESERVRAVCTEGLRLSDRDRLATLTGKGTPEQTFALQRAVFDCLEHCRQGPKIHSKL